MILWPNRFAAFSVFLLAVSLASGCATLSRVIGFEDQMRQARANSTVTGRVDTEGPVEGSLVVVLARLIEGQGERGEQEELIGIDTYVRVTRGTYRFIVSPGRYRLGAYEDRNGNGLADPGERGFAPKDSKVIEVGPGEEASFDIHLKSLQGVANLTEPLDVFALVARTPIEQRGFSLWAFSVQGGVHGDLGDARFGPESGRRGLWEPMDFLNDQLAGIYFLEPYDGRKVPVLFVHGLGGYPQHFTTLIEELDKDRFQPWVYFYPSGFGMEGIANHLATLLSRVQVEYDVDEVAIVAHSMGGLVSRDAILKYRQQSQRDCVRFFMSFSTPWSGDVDAAPVDDAPIQLPESLHDLNPASDYLRGLFWANEDRTVQRRLPADAQYHLVLGFGMRGSRGVANDGSVTVASQARLEAQEQATTVRALDYSHIDILRSVEAVAHLNSLLEERF